MYGRLSALSETVSSPEVSVPATAVVVAGDEETRVLLRGLLRLQHFRIAGDAEGTSHALELVRNHRPALLVADANLAEGSPSVLIANARAMHSSLRVILIAPAAHLPEYVLDSAHRPDVVLPRPFRIAQFALAVRPDGFSPRGVT